MFGMELRLPIDAKRAGVAADLDPPPPFPFADLDPRPNFPFKNRLYYTW